MNKISKQEKRFIRRELINKALHGHTIGKGTAPSESGNASHIECKDIQNNSPLIHPA